MFNANTQWINIVAFHLVNSVASKQLNSIMLLLAPSYFVVLPAIALYLIIRKDTRVYALIAFYIISFLVGYGLKAVFMEPRPCFVQSLSWINAPSCESGYSFPSDHAVVLVGVILFLGAYRRIGALYTLWVALEMFGRVYLGAHYLTDVIAGIAISIAVAYVIYRYRNRIYGIAKALHIAVLTPKQ